MVADQVMLPSQADIDAAHQLLARLGVRPADLLARPSSTRRVPTFAEYVPVVSAAVSDGTRRVYCYYWQRVLDRWGDRRLTEPTASEIRQLAETVKDEVVVRRSNRGGRTAAEHLISCLRCLYNQAVADGVLMATENTAARVPRPVRLPSARRALPFGLVAEIVQVAGSTGNDPELDVLLLRLHLETAARRAGGLALRPIDLDVDQCLIRLREKAGSLRWQPVSPDLMSQLARHAEERHAPPEDQLLRTRRGKLISHRRYDNLWVRIGRHVPTVATQQISTHWLRHTTLTWVERTFGYAVAQAYAGHQPRRPFGGHTDTYVRAGIDEVAAALAALTGQSHPLALADVLTLNSSSASASPLSAVWP